MFRGSNPSRRLAALLLVVPLTAASAQGRCGGDRATTPACDTTPAKFPFAPTGWKTVALSHFTVQATDVRREAAYYGALMNWTLRSDDGTTSILEMGNAGAVIVRGGYQAPPAPAQPAGDTSGGRAGRGNRAPRRVAWDGFCFVIANWDASTMRAALESRGLHPIADNDGKFESFHVKDPDGFDVQIANRPRLVSAGVMQAGAAAAPAPFAMTNWKTVWLDHISFEVSNYKESAAFYMALLGWTGTGDEGSQNELVMGDAGNIIVRGGNPATFGANRPPRRVSVGHVSFGISPWDADGVKKELDTRSLTGRPDTGGKGDIHTASYQSYHTTTPDGFDLQISNATKATRTVR